MPCYDSRDDLIRSSIVEDCNKREKLLKDRNDHLARMLCGLCTILERAGQNRDRYPQSYIRDVKDLPEWWEKHKEFDRKRDKPRMKAKKKG